jgi:hypothetical protein
MSGNLIQAKLAEISEQFISIQNENALMFDYAIKIDESKLEEYKRIQNDFSRMQEELLKLIRNSQTG